MKLSINQINKALFENTFQTATRAFGAIGFLFLITLGLYLSFQYQEGSLCDRCGGNYCSLKDNSSSVSNDDNEATSSANKYHWQSPTPCDPVVEYQESSFFELHFNESSLKRFYDPVKVKSFQREVIEKNQKFKALMLQDRKALMARIEVALRNRFGGKAPLYVPAIDQGDTRALERLELSELAKQLQQASDVTPTESNLNKIGNNIELLKQVKMQVDQLIEEEQQGKARVLRVASTLNPQLNFMWLYHSGNGWIFELIFWSLMGLYSCTLVSLIQKTRNKTYDSTEFVMLFPRILLAPVMAVVVVALILSGYASQDMNLNNFPYFLLLSFFLGFNSENVNGMIRDVSNKILKPIAFSSDKLRASMKQTPLKLEHSKQAEITSAKRPASFDELNLVFRTVAKAKAEEVVITSQLGKEKRV